MPTSNTQLKDFIYLDIDRVRSFVAQLYQGIPEAFEERKGTEKTGKGEAGVEIHGLVKLGIGGDILYQKSATETRSAHHYLYILFEQKLVELDRLLKVDQSFEIGKWTPANFEDGTFVLVHGKVQIVDYRSVVTAFQMIPRITEIALTFQKQTLRQQLQGGKISQSQYDKQAGATGVPTLNKKDVQQISEMVDKLYSGISRVKVFPFASDDRHRFVGNTTHEYFPTVPFNPLMSSGLLSAANWYVMGLVNGAASYSSMPYSRWTEGMVQNIEDSLEQGVFAMQEISKFTLSIEFPAISIVPIAIYRPC
jgi:hypothetical protein